MKPKLLNFDEFTNELVDKIRGAKKNITISVMVMHADPATVVVFDEIDKAIDRGVKVKIYLDSYTKSWRTEDLLERLKYWPRTEEYLNLFSRKSAIVIFGGRVGLNPFANRIHQKIYLIDDMAYVGGVNLGFEKAKNDLMVRFKDRKLVKWLDEWLRGFFSNKSDLPTQYKVSSETIILMDNREKSLIYGEFSKLAKECHKASISSRMCPSGPAMRYLKNKDIKYYFNPLKNMALPTKIAILWDSHKWQIKNSYTGQKYIHAKCAIFDDKIAVVCSNNFNYRGPAWHTTEVGVITTEELLVKDIQEFFDGLGA